MSHTGILQPDRRVPTGARRAAASAGLRHLARKMEASHPALNTPGHLRDAARELDRGNTEGAQRHLRAGLQDLQPVNLYRHGITDDQGHTGARQHLTSIHRHLLNVRDIEDMRRPVLPVGGASFETDRVTGIPAPAGMTTGNRAMNAPGKPPKGRSDRTAEGPRAPSPVSSKQQTYTMPSHRSILDLAGPEGYVHGWIKVSGPGMGNLDVEGIRARHGDEAANHLRAADEAAQAGRGNEAVQHFDAADRIVADHAIRTPASQGKMQARADLRAIRFNRKRATLLSNIRPAVLLSAQTARLAVTPAPRGRPGGPGLYDVKGLGHTDYLQQIVKALIEKRGMPPGRAYAIARGAIRRWMRGGGKVHPEVRAAASSAEAGELTRQAIAHSHSWGDVETAIELATLDFGGPGSGNPGQARVPAGHPGGGQFTKGSSASKHPPGHPARIAAVTRNHTKSQLLARARAYIQQANQIAAQIRALRAQLPAAAGAGKYSAAAGAGTAAAAAKAATATAAAAKTAAAASTSTRAATTSARTTAQISNRIAQLRQQEHMLRAKAAGLRAQAARL